jgi:hypothetical protein
MPLLTFWLVRLGARGSSARAEGRGCGRGTAGWRELRRERLTIRHIEVVSQRDALDPSGVWMPTGTWRLTPVQRTPTLRGLHPDNPGAEHDEGVLFTVEVTSCTTRTYAEIGIGLGDPAVGPGIERTRPRHRA